MSRSQEELRAIAEHLELILPGTLYVLLIGPDKDKRCNLVSNVPVDRASELQAIMGELAQRPVQHHEQ